MSEQKQHGVPEDYFADACRLALELECLLLSCTDTAVVSKWFDSATEALQQHRDLIAAALKALEAPVRHEPIVDDLLPCPFCGSAVRDYAIEPHEHSVSIGEWKMPAHPGSHVIECNTCEAGMIEYTRDGVLERWNRRASPSPDVQADTARYQWLKNRAEVKPMGPWNYGDDRVLFDLPEIWAYDGEVTRDLDTAIDFAMEEKI